MYVLALPFTDEWIYGKHIILHTTTTKIAEDWQPVPCYNTREKVNGSFTIGIVWRKAQAVKKKTEKNKSEKKERMAQKEKETERLDSYNSCLIYHEKGLAS